jgi:hypothetical protein
LGQREFLSYDRRVKITMGVTLAPELAEAIKESAERQGLSFDDWIVAAAELKFRSDDETAIFEEAEHKRRMAGLREYMDEYQAEFGAFTEEEMAETRRERLEAHRRAEEYWARKEADAPGIGEAAREAAAREGKSFDNWLATAVELKLRTDEDAENLKRAEHERRMRGLGEFLDEWEAEHGAFTDEEMARASRELGLPWPPEGKCA